MTLAAAYLAGLVSTPAALMAVLGGLRWWRALRRSEAASEETPFDPTPVPPPPPLSQDDFRVRSVRWGVSPSRVHRRRNGR